MELKITKDMKRTVKYNFWIKIKTVLPFPCPIGLFHYFEGFEVLAGAFCRLVKSRLNGAVLKDLYHKAVF